MRDSKGRFIKGNTEGFQKGHPPYNNALELWRKNGGRSWMKGKFGKDSISFGVIFTEERKRKIAEKLKGNRNSLGYQHSEKAKKKISEFHKGRKYQLGKTWGAHKQQDKRNDVAYRDFVKKVKERDNYSCMLKNQECSGYNIVHHIYGWAAYPELRYSINNGITLCQAHHPRGKKNEQRLIPFLKHLVGSYEQ